MSCEREACTYTEPTPVRSDVQVVPLAGFFLQQWQLCLQLLHSEHEPVPSRRRAHHLIIQTMEHLCSKSAGMQWGPISGIICHSMNLRRICLKFRFQQMSNTASSIHGGQTLVALMRICTFPCFNLQVSEIIRALLQR
jgi:hypothetical protein